MYIECNNCQVATTKTEEDLYYNWNLRDNQILEHGTFIRMGCQKGVKGFQESSDIVREFSQHIEIQFRILQWPCLKEFMKYSITFLINFDYENINGIHKMSTAPLRNWPRSICF